MDRIGVETHTRSGIDLARVQLPPRIRKRRHGLGMNDQVLVHLHAGLGAKFFAHLPASVCGATNHAVFVGIDDRDLDAGMALQRAANLVDGRLKPPIRPVRRHVRAPCLPRCFEVSAYMALIHGRFGYLVQQVARIFPVAKRKQCIGLSERQANRGVRLHFQNIQQQDRMRLTDQRACTKLLEFGKAGARKQCRDLFRAGKFR